MRINPLSTATEIQRTYATQASSKTDDYIEILVDSSGRIIWQRSYSEAEARVRFVDFAAALEKCVLEASSSDWDAYGAAAVQPATRSAAYRFLSALPKAVPLPDIGADPDGDISFEWRVGPRRVLTVSIDANGVLSFAATVGFRETHGRDDMAGTIPYSVLHTLHDLYF